MQVFRLFVIFIFSHYSFIAFAGNGSDCHETKNKKALKLYEQASYSTERDAINLLKEALTIEPDFVEAHYILADIYLSKADKAVSNPSEFQKIDRYYKNAESHWLKVAEFCPSYYEYITYFNLAEFYFYSRQYKNARKYYDLYAKNNKTDVKKIKESEKNIDKLDRYFAIMTNPVPFNPKSLPGVSSNKNEFLPLISPDGEYAFYTRRFEEQKMGELTASTKDEFTYSKLLDLPGTEIDYYSDGSVMPSPFNDGRDQGGVSITIDNKHMYLTICQMTNTMVGAYKNCDIYSSDFVDGQWTRPYNLGPNINDKLTWEGQPSVSSDGKTLYFASTREGNIGISEWVMTSDIYVSTQDENGNWSKAKNLGSTVNSPGNDKSPFIHSDSQTLYFSSDGHLGLGGYDIFYTRKDKGKWLEPINLGFPINTESDDLGFSVSLKGDKAYFSSNKLSGKGGYDIYSFDLYENARPEEVVIVKGQLLAENGDPIQDAEIVVKSTKSAKVTKGMVDKKTGEYAIALTVTDNTIPKPIDDKNENTLLTENSLNNKIQNNYTSTQDLDIFEVFAEIENSNLSTENKEIIHKEIIQLFENNNNSDMALSTNDSIKPEIISTIKKTELLDVFEVFKQLEETPVSKELSETMQEEVLSKLKTENIEKAEKLNSRIENPYIIKKEPPKISEDDFVITVKKKGFAFTSSYIKPKELTQLDRPVLSENFEMKPVEIGKTVKLNNIQFATNSAELTRESVSILDDFYEFLSENPNIKIAIHGHTDNVGDDEKNLILSEERAKSVYTYLLFLDVAPERMTYKGFGETKPIASNSNETGRALNRRTEFVIVEK